MKKAELSPECQALLKRMRFVRKYNNLTLAQIAHEAGMRVATITNQFSGYYNFDIRVVLAVVRLSPNVSAEYILRGQGDVLCHDQDELSDINKRLSALELAVEARARTRI